MQELIERFWECSINNKMDSFDFDEFFRNFKPRLKSKLSSHGILSFEDYLDEMKNYYDMNKLKGYSYVSEHTGFVANHRDLLELIFRPRYEHFHRKYSKDKVYVSLLETYHELQSWHKLSKEEKVFLVDKCIHLEHNSGKLIELLRESYENDENFGIKTRKGIEFSIDGEYQVIFLDFDEVRKLNKEKGYEQTNEMFRKLFKQFRFRKEDIVGRWFSGDEIVILTKGDVWSLLQRFKEHTNTLGITFKYKVFPIKSLSDLKDEINKVRW